MWQASVTMPNPTTLPQRKSNGLDRKPLRRILKKCDKVAEVSSLNGWLLEVAWEGKNSVLFKENLTVL